MIYWLVIIFTIPFIAIAQDSDTLYLENCYKLLYKNWPTLKNDTLYEQSSDYRTKNINSTYLPQIGINAQTTYQSDVTQINISFPGIKIDSPSKDQYKATLDVNQLIFDAGLTQSRKKLENANLLIDKQKIIIDINSKKEQINFLFFNILLLQETENLQNALRTKIQEKLVVLQSCVTNGILTESDIFTLQAELLKIDQQISEVRISQEGLITSLSIFTGQEIPKGSKFGYPSPSFSFTDNVLRPELELFNLNKLQLDASENISKKTLLPKLYGFGQAGYGSPGLNMLSNDFQKFYIVGAKLSWSPWDWNQCSRDRKILEIQKEIISNQQDAFIKNVNVQSENEITTIKKMEELILKDEEIIKLREKITMVSFSKLTNGTIRSSDYIDDITAENQAKIEMKKHQIQILFAKFNYMVIKGLI